MTNLAKQIIDNLQNALIGAENTLQYEKVSYTEVTQIFSLACVLLARECKCKLSLVSISENIDLDTGEVLLHNFVFLAAFKNEYHSFFLLDKYIKPFLFPYFDSLLYRLKYENSFEYFEAHIREGPGSYGEVEKKVKVSYSELKQEICISKDKYILQDIGVTEDRKKSLINPNLRLLDLNEKTQNEVFMLF